MSDQAVGAIYDQSVIAADAHLEREHFAKCAVAQPPDIRAYSRHQHSEEKQRRRPDILRPPPCAELSEKGMNMRSPRHLQSEDDAYLAYGGGPTNNLHRQSK
jgi:hypothetical protein